MTDELAGKDAGFQSKSILYISFFCLFLYGFIDNLKGVTLPELLNDLKIPYFTGGSIQQGAYFGFLVATLLTGYLIQRLTHRDILLIAAICLTTGILIYSRSRNSTILLTAMISIGLGLGFLDLVGIRLITDYYKNQTGQLLNLSAFFHGLASMTAPLFAGFLILNNQTWDKSYQLSLLLVGSFILILFLVRIPRISNTAPLQPIPQGQLISALRDKRARAYYFLIISYEAIEIGLAVWLNEFLISNAELSSTLGISYISLFFLFLTIGRLIGSLIIEKIGYLKLIFFSSLGVFACLVLGIFGGKSLLFLLPVTGLFLSTIFPTTTAAASQDITDNLDMSLSLFFTFAGLGGMIGSWMIGTIANYVGLRTGISFLTLMALNITIISLLKMINRRKTQKTTHSQREVSNG